MDKWEYYKLLREHLDDALSKLSDKDFDWLLDRLEDDIKELKEN